MIGAAIGVVETAGEERFRLFGLVGDAANVVEQRGEVGPLLGETSRHGGELGRFVERSAVRLRQLFHPADEILFLLVELARAEAHVAHLVGEALGGLAAEVIAGLLQSLLRASAGGQSLRRGVGFERLGSALRVVAGLIELLACLRHVGTILRLIHALAEVVHVGQEFLLLVAEAL